MIGDPMIATTLPTLLRPDTSNHTQECPLALQTRGNPFALLPKRWTKCLVVDIESCAFLVSFLFRLLSLKSAALRKESPSLLRSEDFRVLLLGLGATA